MGFSTAECTFAARQDFSNLFSGFHLNCTIHLLPTTKITTWFDETFVCRVKSLQFKNLQMYTYSCLLTKHTSAQERAKKGYKRQGNMLKVGFCCFKKLELNTKCKYSNTAMQKTYPYAFKLFTSFKLLLVNVYQDKYCKALPQMFCCKDIFLACQPLIFILEINHNPKSNYQLSSYFYYAMWLCFFHTGCHLRSRMKSRRSRGQKISKNLNGKPLQMARYVNEPSLILEHFGK